MDQYEESRVVGVVGMKGIGKTKLAEMLFEERKREFERSIFFKKDIRKKSGKKLDLLLSQFLHSILKMKENVTITKHACVKEKLLETKYFIVLDGFTEKEEINHLLGDCEWIKQGSKIVIVASDKSLVEGLVDDTYVVTGLDENQGLECLSYHAFGDAKRFASEEGSLLTLSRKFVDYAKGNPTALTLLGKQLWRRDESEWKSILSTLETSPNKSIQDLLYSCYDGLTEPQQDAFLDITCFFRSQDHNFVKTMVESSCESIIKDLADKFLIEISCDRVEVNGLLYQLGKRLASQEHDFRLLNQQDIIQALKDKVPNIFPGEGVRGIFLDISGIRTRALREKAFEDMKKLRYLKIYNSRTSFPESNGDLIIRNGLKFTFEEVRYLHWLKYPLKELPKDFSPKNLIDLELPQSEIERLWDVGKDVKKLKWVDLSHSVKLQDLSGLLGAENLQRLNLEGCIELTMLQKEVMQTMKSLVFLNLRSCTSLVSLPEINIKSLKTLILSECANFEKFEMFSENLQALYLDGTALKELPESIIELQKLVVLNMKNCKKLASVPNSLVKLQALQELILSGCSMLKRFPDVNETIKKLRILLLDGTAINQFPQVFSSSMNGLSLLRRLCLSRNTEIQTLDAHIGQLYHLKCLDLKYCKKLTFIPMLPPNLQCFDAHGCESLTTVANPLAFLNLTDQIQSTFIFSDCNNLEEVAKSCIISYIHKKSQLMSNALNRYNLGSCVEHYTGACFPGCEVPQWFFYQNYGPKIEAALPGHWSQNKIIGIALCAVVSFHDYLDQNNGFLVKCTCEFENANECFSCIVGGSTGPEMEPRKIESDHVFVGYTSLLQIKKQSKADEKNVYTFSKASFTFQVIDGAEKMVKCKVLKCGFSMIYKPEGTDHDNVSWEVNSDGSLVVDNNVHDGESMSFPTQEANDNSTDEQGSCSNDDKYQQEKQKSCVSLELNGSTQCNVGANENSTIEPNEMESTTSMPHGIPTGDGETQIIHVKRDPTCFSFLESFIPFLRIKEPAIKPHGQVQESVTMLVEPKPTNLELLLD